MAQTEFEKQLNWGLQAIGYNLGETVYCAEIMRENGGINLFKRRRIEPVTVKRRVTKEEGFFKVFYNLLLRGDVSEFVGESPAKLESIIDKTTSRVKELNIDTEFEKALALGGCLEEVKTVQYLITAGQSKVGASMQGTNLITAVSGAAYKHLFEDSRIVRAYNAKEMTTLVLKDIKALEETYSREEALRRE